VKEELKILTSHKFVDYREGIFNLRYSDDATLLVAGYGDGGIDVRSFGCFILYGMKIPRPSFKKILFPVHL
jgi:hypothetical protein